MADETILVIDVGATRTRMGLVNDGRLSARSEKLTADLAERRHGVSEALVALAHELAAPGAESRPPVAIGLSLAAAVDADGSVLQPREFGIPGGPVLRDALAAGLRLPVAVDNDANLAALAEHRLGAARGARMAAVLTIGTNIGLGLILEGRVYRGAHGAAGEAGLLLVPARSDGLAAGDRRPVDAGRFGRRTSAAPEGYAWIEELVGGGALASAALGNRSARLDRLGSPLRVLAARASTDHALRPLADRAVEGWAFILADLQVVLDLEVVVLTGGVAADAAHVLPRLRRRVAELVAIPPEIRLGTLGPDAELIGAGLLAQTVTAA